MEPKPPPFTLLVSVAPVALDEPQVKLNAAPGVVVATSCVRVHVGAGCTHVEPFHVVGAGQSQLLPVQVRPPVHTQEVPDCTVPAGGELWLPAMLSQTSTVGVAVT